MKLLTQFWDFVDTRAVIRRIMSLGTFALTVHVILWAVEFATWSSRSGGEIAMIVGAIMAPMNILWGYMFHAYSKARAQNGA